MLSWLPALAAGTVLFVGEPAATYVGRDNQIHVAIPRIGSDASVDGHLDEAAWQQAALLTGFSQFSPQDGIPAADSTEVLLWYSSGALYIGVRAFEAHGGVHATLADRDKMAADDDIQILLGTFPAQLQAFVFGVNPYVIQLDGTLVESGQSLSTGGFTGAVAARAAPDLSQDFVFTSKGRLTDYGFEVEIRIPFKSLKYQAANVQSWDLNVMRKVQHSGYEDTWAPAKRSNASFLAQSGTIDGLRGLDRGLVLDLNPIVTQKATGSRAAAGWSYNRGTPQIGGNVRWGVTNNLTLNGTGHPDFAEVESDAGQIIIDPRQSLFFAEKRPFFLDGLEYFTVPHQLVYTRRVVNPAAAAKLTGKMAGTSIGVLSAVDDRSLSASGHDAPFYNIVRAQRDAGGQSRFGMLYTDREAGAAYNRVVDVDGRVVFRKVYSTSVQLEESRTKQGTMATRAPLWEGIFNRNGKSFSVRYALTGIDENFRASSGFISRPGVAQSSIDHRWTWFGTRGNAVESFSTDVLLNGVWQYSHFVRRGDAQNKMFHLSTSTGLRGGWLAGAAAYWETFGFDEQLYSTYRVERTVGTTIDTVAFTGTPRIPNHDYVLSMSTPQFARFTGSLVYLWGRDENFFEWAQADIHYVSMSVSARPTNRVRIDGTYAFQDFWRRTDRSRVGRTLIPRLKLEYQLTTSVFLRAVGEYDLSEHDDLRDETRTFFPLIIRGSRAIATRNASFHGDCLFSYRPNPGTVLFVGYGSRADAPPNPLDRFEFQPLVRSSDYVFVKYSYLLRM